MLKAISAAILGNKKKPQQALQEQQAAVKRIGEMPIEIKPRAIPVRYELPAATAMRLNYLLEQQKKALESIQANIGTQIQALQAQSNAIGEKIRTETRFRLEERLNDFKEAENIPQYVPYTVDGDCIIFMYPPDLAPKPEPEPSTDED